MTSEVTESLEKIIRQAGYGPLLESEGPENAARILDLLTKRLSAADEIAKARWENNAPRLTPGALAEELHSNPHKVVAFVDAMKCTKSPEMLVMVWRILEGMRIGDVELSYRFLEEFSMRVSLFWSSEDSTDPSPQVFETTDISDFNILKRFGTIKKNGKPAFDGFYSLPDQSRSPRT
jgi:hypothetical protein